MRERYSDGRRIGGSPVSVGSPIANPEEIVAAFILREGREHPIRLTTQPRLDTQLAIHRRESHASHVLA
jgi:hypothetical protein